MTSSFAADLASMRRRTRSNRSTPSPIHTDEGAEHENYSQAEEVALGLAKRQGRSAWYEETPHSGRRTLVKSFRDSD
jgi:hypothetical protein